MNWKNEIAAAWLIKQSMMELDRQGLYSYKLPEIAATEEQILGAESKLRLKLDTRYREFLSYANGWKSFLQETDLFGTNELLEGEVHDSAQMKVELLDGSVLSRSGVSRSQILPIAASISDRDLAVMIKEDQNNAGEIIWFGGTEIGRFKTFDEYFLAMVDYNRLELQRFKDVS